MAKINAGPMAKPHGSAIWAVEVNEKHAISPNCKVLSRVQRQGRLCDAPLEVRNRNDRGRVGCRSPGPRSEYLAHLVEFLERIMHPMPRSGTAPLGQARSEEHTSELQSLMRISYAVFCLKKKKTHQSIYNVMSLYESLTVVYQRDYTNHN